MGLHSWVFVARVPQLLEDLFGCTIHGSAVTWECRRCKRRKVQYKR